MPAIPRDHPYIWATWLPRLLVGDNSCEWAIWFKAHYQKWTRAPSEFDPTQWQLAHTALLNDIRDCWLANGYDVFVEQQNAFQLKGRSAILAGRPDLVAVKDNYALIMDAKTGQEQAWHRVQLMIYMYALPRAMPEFRDARISGEIVYPDRVQRVPQGGIHQGFVRDLSALIRRVAAPEPPARVPSASECRFCDIIANDCPDRVDADAAPATGDTDDF